MVPTRMKRAGDALTLDDVHTHRRRVQQGVDEVVVEQVHLVDVEDAAVGGGKQTRLETTLSVLERMLEVEGADESVLGRGDGEFDDPGRPGRDRERSLLRADAALVTQRMLVVGVAGEPAPVDHLDLRQDVGQGPDRGRLGRALVAAHQHAADARVDGVDQQGGLERLLTDDRGERKDVAGAPHTDFHWNEPHVEGLS
jgi:hypothetical protein